MKFNLDKIKSLAKEAKLRITNELPHAKELLSQSVSSTLYLSKKTGKILSERCDESIETTRKIIESDESKIIIRKTKELAKNANHSTALTLSSAANKSGECIRETLTQEKVHKLVEATKNVAVTATQSISSVTKNITGGKTDTEKQSPKKEIENTIQTLKGKDKIGLTGEGMAAIGGVAAGAAAAGTMASMAGASTLLGSTTLASVLGGIFVTTTPVGWVIGSASLAGAAGYGIAKMIRSGTQQDQVRQEIIERLNQRLLKVQASENASKVITELNQLLTVAVASKLIQNESAQKMVFLIEQGKLDPELALKRIKSMLLTTEVIMETPGN